jgi:agmatine deiminase
MRQLITLGCLFAVLLLSMTAAAADRPQQDYLPIGLTDEEMLRLDEIGINHINTAAPTGVIRNPAEWEPSQGVIIRWPLGISVAIVAEMSENLMVTCIVANSSEETSARNSFTSGGVTMSHVQFLQAPTNTYWTRDYGPWFIFDDGEMAIVDPIYNRPRPQDDVIPQAIGTAWGMTVFGMDLITPGGNHMSNGLGMSMSSDLVYNENPTKTHAQVDSIILAYLGNDYTVMVDVETSGIHHIDCWAKFLNPTTIMVKDVPSSDPSYAALNNRAQFLSQQISAWGRPYTIVRVYCPSGTAYTNSIILGNKVLVPTFTNTYDAVAIQTYQNAMPGYEIIGFTGSWLDDDAIHCRAMGVPDREMLFVNHVPLWGEVGDGTANFPISVQIDACSDSALVTDSLKVYYRVGGGSWEYTMLTASAQSDMFEGGIPAQPTGSRIDYYIKAADRSGRVVTHPYIGASWAHSFTVGGPHAPSQPSALYPTDSSQPLYEMLPTIQWSEATDPDLGDTVRYRLELSLDETFSTPDVIDSIPSNSYTMIDSLAFGTLYWWRVTAFDRTGLEATSAPRTFWTWTLGDLDRTHIVTMSDLTILIDHLFISLSPIEPPRVGDLDGDCMITMSDLTIMIDNLFISLAPLTIPGCD